MESNQAEQIEKNRIMQKENRLSELSDHIKNNNIHIIGIPEREEREKEVKHLFEEVIAENCPNLEKETYPNPEGTEISQKKINQRRSTPRHMIMKIPKISEREKILKISKSVSYKGNHIRRSVDFLSEILQARWERNGIFKVLKGKILQS